MLTYRISLLKIRSVSKFVTVMNSVRSSVMVTDKSHRINAKSLLGVMSLDKANPVKLEIDVENESEISNVITFVRTLEV